MSRLNLEAMEECGINICWVEQVPTIWNWVIWPWPHRTYGYFDHALSANRHVCTYLA